MQRLQISHYSWMWENPKFDTSIQNDPEGTPEREVRGECFAPFSSKHFESHLSSYFLKSKFDLQRKMYIFPASISICSVFRFFTWMWENPKFDTSIQNNTEGAPEPEDRGGCFAPWQPDFHNLFPSILQFMWVHTFWNQSLAVNRKCIFFLQQFEYAESSDFSFGCLRFPNLKPRSKTTRRAPLNPKSEESASHHDDQTFTIWFQAFCKAFLTLSKIKVSLSKQNVYFSYSHLNVQSLQISHLNVRKSQIWHLDPERPGGHLWTRSQRRALRTF